jgi:hypothetical protein
MGFIELLFTNPKRDALAQWVKEHDTYDYTGACVPLRNSAEYDYMSMERLKEVKEEIERCHQRKVYRDAHPAPNHNVGRYVEVYVYGKNVNGYPHVTNVTQEGDKTVFTRMLEDGTFKHETYHGGGVTWSYES